MKKQILIYYIAFFLIISGTILELSLDHWWSVIILLGFILYLIYQNIKIKQESKIIEAETYYFNVDHTKSPKELISDGNYDWKNKDLNEFPFNTLDNVNKIIKVAAKIFNYEGSNEEAEKEMESMGFRSATAFEFLAFGATHSEVQRKFPIIALGTIYKGYLENAHCLCSYNCSSKREPGQRGLGFHYYVFGEKEENCHLLGIKILE